MKVIMEVLYKNGGKVQILLFEFSPLFEWKANERFPDCLHIMYCLGRWDGRLNITEGRNNERKSWAPYFPSLNKSTWVPGCIMQKWIDSSAEMEWISSECNLMLSWRYWTYVFCVNHEWISWNTFWIFFLLLNFSSNSGGKRSVAP